MKYLNKGVKLLVAVITVLALGVGCAGPGATDQNGDTPVNTNQTGTGPAQEEVEIEFSFWGNQEEIDNKNRLIEAFQTEFPHIKVKPVFSDGGQYPTRMQTWFSSGDVPDAMQIAADTIFDYVNEGMFEDLTPYIEEAELQDAWNESALNNFRYDGKFYGLPHVYHVYVIAYNKALFDAAGLDYPTADWTVEEFRSMAETLTEGEGAGKTYGLGGFGAFAANEYIHAFGGPVYGWENGFEIFPEGDEGLIEGVNFFKGMIDEGSTPSPDSDANDIGFDSGRFGMYVAAPWWMATWQELIEDFEWDLVTFPKKPDGESLHARVYPNGMAIPAAAEHKEEAWELIKYLTANEEAQTIASESGMPNLSALAESEAFLNDYPEGWQPYNRMAFVDALDSTWMVQNTGNFDQINTIIQNEFTNVVNGNLSPEDYAELIRAKGEELMTP